MAEVFRCGEPKGIAMRSLQNHKVAPDGFAGVQPVVIVEGAEMTIVWGDTKLINPGAADKVWKAVVFLHTEDTISGVALDDGPRGTASMLYTITSVRLKIEQNQLVIGGRRNGFGGIGLQGA